MKLSVFIAMFWILGLSACKDQAKTVSEESLVDEALPSAKDFSQALILPDSAALSSGKTVSFEALGLLPYDKSQSISKLGSWTIADSSVVGPYEDGTIGRFRARSPGTTTINFVYDTISISATVSVSPKVLELLKISHDDLSVTLEGVSGGYLSISKQLQVYGIYSDGSSEELTTDAIWSSADESILSSKGNGLFEAKAPGKSELTVTVNDVTSSIPVAVLSTDRHFTSFSITPDTFIVPLNTDMPYKVVANFSNGESEDVTSATALSMDDAALLTLTSGNLQGKNLGSGSATISWSGESVSIPVRVVETQALEIVITSPSKNFSMYKGEKENFKAFLKYSDGSQQNVTSLVTWTVDDISFLGKAGSGDDYGYYQSLKEGSPLLTLTFGAFKLEKKVTILAAALVSIAVTGDSTGTIGQFTSRTYVAKGTYTDGSVRTLTGANAATWKYKHAAGAETSFASATILNGAATATQGVVTVTVAFSGKTLSFDETIGPPVPVELTILPATDETYTDVSLASGTQNMTVNATYSDGSIVDKTSEASWSYDFSGTGEVFAGYVRDEVGFKGQLNLLSTGRFRVTATLGTLTGITTVRVAP